MQSHCHHHPDLIVGKATNANILSQSAAVYAVFLSKAAFLIPEGC